ncbi:MAG TPA: type II CAAX endopeptidase family protein [Magnetospirillaceae bacterium]|nr:type II CAAX endopeptidase family protein [Magnetospirillaceae bacterium]
MEQAKGRVWAKIAFFYLVTTALTALFNVGGRHAPGNIVYVTGAMWSPAIAALLTQRLFGDPISALGWGWAKGGWQRLAYLLPLAYAVPVYAVTWATGLGGVYDHAFVEKMSVEYGLTGLAPAAAIALYVALTASVGLVPKTARALGEEIGWRGFLVPELAKVVSFPLVGLISGLLWALWHFPAILFGTYNAGTPPWVSLSCFTVMVVADGFIAAWIRLRSGSVWPAAILHGSHNMFIQLIFTPLTADTGPTPYVIDEFGVGLALSSVVVAAILCRRPAIAEQEE